MRKYSFRVAVFLTLMLSLIVTVTIPAHAEGKEDSGSKLVIGETFGKDTITIYGKTTTKPGDPSTQVFVGGLGWGDSELKQAWYLFHDGAVGRSYTDGYIATYLVSVNGKFYKNGNKQDEGNLSNSASVSWQSSFVAGTSSDTFRETGVHTVTNGLSAGVGNSWTEGHF